MDILALEAMRARGQDNLLLRLGLGGEYARLGEYDKAIPHLQAAIAFDPQHAAAWKLLAKTLAASGRLEEARRAYEDGIRAALAGGHIQAAREMTVFRKRLDKPGG
ncbi:bacterial transcriptional activator domain-containing protein [Acidiferrobacter sp.]|uniref:bacterial transcriptional activator domain-containing protein n=1 Tax=Acidiferrobacter sp. TaxID=1872107 RepID=UPI00260E00BA|nr:bacterial transcriptional activator domain-containing protein [Acidiferrobacter sp.]